MPSDILTAIIGATSALVGVAVGGYFTALNQRRERQHRHISEQLAQFYSPLLSLRMSVLTKSELRLKVSGAGNAAWQEIIVDAREGGVEEVKKVRAERFPSFEKIITDDNRRFEEEIMPSYRKIVEIFTANLHHAEPSTIQHFAALLEYLEVWDRWLDKSLPHEVVGKLDHSEKNLHPLYKDVEVHFTQLQNSLREKRKWRWWKQSPTVRVLPYQ